MLMLLQLHARVCKLNIVGCPPWMLTAACPRLPSRCKRWCLVIRPHVQLSLSNWVVKLLLPIFVSGRLVVHVEKVISIHTVNLLMLIWNWDILWLDYRVPEAISSWCELMKHWFLCPWRALALLRDHQIHFRFGNIFHMRNVRAPTC